MDEVVSSYLTAFDELNVLTSTSYQMAGGDYSARVNQIVDDVLSFLINAYALGIRNAGIMLDHELSVNVDKMQDAIFLVIEGKTFADRVEDHVVANDLEGLKNLVESEHHRVYNTAVYDGGKDYSDNIKSDITKTWITVGDDKVRETHSYLEGQSVPLEEEFFTFDGDHAAYPGGFTEASNNVNCRCFITLNNK